MIDRSLDAGCPLEEALSCSAGLPRGGSVYCRALWLAERLALRPGGLMLVIPPDAGGALLALASLPLYDLGFDLRLLGCRTPAPENPLLDELLPAPPPPAPRLD